MIDQSLLERFAARARDVQVYERTWWAQREEPQLSFLRDHPNVRQALLTLTQADIPIWTELVYSPDGGQTWDPTRIELHDELLAGLDDDDAAAADAGARSIYFLLGLPGSGKTKALRPLATIHADLAGPVPVIDADEVRGRFPEYGHGLGSGVVQAETALLTYGTGYRLGDGRQDRVLAHSQIIMLDTIGDPEFLPATVERAAEQGRTIYVLRTECPPEVCKERAMRRALEDGRHVPIELIDQKVGYPEKALAAARETGLVAGWAVIDTEDKQPTLITGSADFADLPFGSPSASGRE